MPDINPSIPIVGQPDSTEEPKIVTALSQLIAAVDNVDTDQITDGTIAPVDLSAALLDTLGVTSGGITRRGKASIATSESRTNTAYGYLTTPDKVTGLVLPTDGLLLVGYRATWQESVGGAGRAALFVGANQIKVPGTLSGGAGPVLQAAASGSASGGADHALVSSSVGLISGSAVDTPVTTGTILGGFWAGNPGVMATEVGGTVVSFANLNANAGGLIAIQAAAGTYDVGVQFKSSSGSVTVHDRHLWALALAF